jgi:hypothetical protein
MFNFDIHYYFCIETLQYLFFKASNYTVYIKGPCHEVFDAQCKKKLIQGPKLVKTLSTH